MDFKSDAQLDSGSVVGASGGGGGYGGGRSGGTGRGGGVAIGGIGGLIVLILALFLGLDPASVLGGASGGVGGAANTAGATSNSRCQTGADIANNQDCRWVAYMTSLRQYWNGEQQISKPRQMVAFSGQIQTACGTASSQVGPFYCPGDQTIYIDTNFADQLLQQLGANTSYISEAYIVAHEYGHHVQNVIGVLDKGQDGQTGPTSNAVRIELQADCFAGVWLRWANDNPNDAIENITQQDLNDVVLAAQSVGDDHIQEQTQGSVNQDGWTHGSSKMRQYWVDRGFKTGDPNQCDTFATNQLGG